MVMRGVKLNSIKEMKRNFSVDELMYSFCSGELDRTEAKIKVLRSGGDGGVTASDLDTEGTGN